MDKPASDDSIESYWATERNLAEGWAAQAAAGPQTTTSRAEHLAWCKARALEYANNGDAVNTVTSMLSDLSKHPETERSAELGAMLALAVAMGPTTPRELRAFVEGFN